MVATVDSHTRRTLELRDEPIKAIVVHTTGATDHKKILSFYRSSTGFQPHYYIEIDGTIHQTARESLVAYHCAIKIEERNLYGQGFAVWSRYRWANSGPKDMGVELSNYALWRSDWISKAQSPLDLITGASPNRASLGIELQANPKPLRKVFHPVQYQALIELSADIEKRHGLRLSRDCYLGHYDCSPMRRSNEHGSTDPGMAFDFDAIIAGVRSING